MKIVLPKSYKFKRNRIGRIGIIDVGSNSVRLVVFDGVSRSPTYFFNEKVLCGLGRGLGKTHYLSVEGKEKTITAIKRFLAITKKMNLNELLGVATAAVRNSIDGLSFVESVNNETGLNLNIVTGYEEAELSANGVLLGWPEARGVVCDIGGGSLELAEVSAGKVGKCATSLLGTLVLQDFRGSEKNFIKFIKSSVADLCKNYGQSKQNIYLVGGSFRAFARIDMARSNYPLRILHEYKISASQALETAAWIMSHSIEDFCALSDTSVDRLSLLPICSKVLVELILSLKAQEVYFSSYGLREGILFSQMPNKFRVLDPLIEGCRYQEALASRSPGFGDKLYEWILPIFQSLSDCDKRLFHAACLLHDTTWKAHPDYRAEMSFETVTRANLGGIDHQGRIFLALALMSRYKKMNPESNISGPLRLLDSRRSDLAIALGRAMRLGAMVSGTSQVNLKKSRLVPEHNSIKLIFRKSGFNLIGDTVESRLNALAKSLGKTSIIEKH